MMTCPKCETLAPDESRVCSSYGMQVGGTATATRVGMSLRFIGLIVSLLLCPIVLIGCSSSNTSTSLDQQSHVSVTSSSAQDREPAASSDSSGRQKSDLQGASSSSASYTDGESEEASSLEGSSSKDADVTPATSKYEGAVTPKDSLDDYSWDEIAVIAGEIANEMDDMKVIEYYGLCAADGTLDGTQVKTVDLANGIQGQVQIIGFNQDDRSDGSGKAGITFAFSDCIDASPMVEDGFSYYAGGWEKTDLRARLGDEVMSLLPQDLQDHIVSVDKKSYLVEASTGALSTSTTSDKLWLLSGREIFGDYDDDVAEADQEGNLYKFFRDAGLQSADDPNSVLVKRNLTADSIDGSGQGEACTWWLRSVLPDTSERYRTVNEKGYAYYHDHHYWGYGIAPCFCM